MPTLPSELRKKLERVVIDARDAAEAGACAALKALAVHESEAYPHLKTHPELLQLRNALRARARQLGDRQDASGRLAIDHLVDECSYEHWHRMLFARFLAENNLLIESQDDMAISLSEAEELAKADGVNVWVFASRCAERMLPHIFRPDDPLLQVSFATEHMLKLEKLLASLPQAVFSASDALGWVYQFWQSKEKERVNRSEVKIGADEISAVTQLFTEPYMVEFLLHNTLGAWWAGKKLAPKDAASAKTEDELRAALVLPGVGWEYLRFVRGADGEGGSWRPASGTFEGWPTTVAELKILDPCCGSGHFLVAALHHLVPIRMAEEGLSADQAVDAVLRDNLHGLEIDERCCQIAAFALAFAAWTYPDRGGYRPLPDLHIACTGIGPQSSAEDWVKLAEQSGIPMPAIGREAIKNGLLNLHRLFSQAPTLGSLINPAELSADLLAAGYGAIQPYLAAIMSAEKADDETRERAVAAAGMVKAAELLAGDYTLISTNVPYLSVSSQDAFLRDFCDEHYTRAKHDLATVVLERIRTLATTGGTTAVVVPQLWMFLSRYRRFREDVLRRSRWDMVARLGPGAFETIGGEVVNVVLFIASNEDPEMHSFPSIDIAEVHSPKAKAIGLVDSQIRWRSQLGQLRNPDSRIVLVDREDHDLLLLRADSRYGLRTADSPRFIQCFWEERVLPSRDWRFHQSTVRHTEAFAGREHILLWQEGRGALAEFAELGLASLQGQDAWGRHGVVVSLMGSLPATIYTGESFDNNCAAVWVKDSSDLPAVWQFVQSSEFQAQVRVIDQALKVTNLSILKIPFAREYWASLAGEPDGGSLPEPESDNPTQWLFHGRPEESTAPLQVAVARLLGYRWPVELDDKMRLSTWARTLVKQCDELAKFADDDGIVCVPSVRGEEPAAERLEALLAAAGVKPAKVREFAGGSDLDEWLRNGFFEEHCKLFHDRPFVWHIWDGRTRDGFHALVNYHKLCEGGGKGRRLLESLTYSYLGEWIARQADGVKHGEGGAEDRLAAAIELQKRLEAILGGEPPVDLFVRWKPLADQAIGWEPDINDGVRMNIRPFLASDLPAGRTGAGVLRWKPNIKWTKDRGKEPQRAKAEYPWFWGWDEETEDFMGTGKEPDGNRHNDCHYRNKIRQAARDSEDGRRMMPDGSVVIA